MRPPKKTPRKPREVAFANIQIDSDNLQVICNNDPCDFWRETVACPRCPIRYLYQQIVINCLLKGHSYIL